MNQDERRFDFHGLGLALKRAREEKGWTQAYVAELVDRDSRTIMNIENKGQYPSFDLFVKLITMFDVSVDQFIHADGGARSSFGDDGGPSGDAKLAERYLSASLSCSGMSLVVDILQLLLNHVGVYLCGGDIRMAQHLLNGSQVCSVLQQVGCKGVP